MTGQGAIQEELQWKVNHSIVSLLLAMTQPISILLNKSINSAFSFKLFIANVEMSCNFKLRDELIR